MPIYEYQCQACGSVHDILQKVSDPVLKKCPECGQSKLKKLVSAPSFRLSGTGWYETDFKTDKDKKRNLSSDESSKNLDSDQNKSKDSKSKENKSDNKGTGNKVSADKPKVKSKKSK